MEIPPYPALQNKTITFYLLLLFIYRLEEGCSCGFWTKKYPVKVVSLDGEEVGE
jgi:tellurite resistance protein TehA-like permease